MAKHPHFTASPSHPILKPVTKFSVGEEVILADGTVGKIVDFKDGKYSVARQRVDKLVDADLKKAK